MCYELLIYAGASGSDVLFCLLGISRARADTHSALTAICNLVYHISMYDTALDMLVMVLNIRCQGVHVERCLCAIPRLWKRVRHNPEQLRCTGGRYLAGRASSRRCAGTPSLEVAPPHELLVVRLWMIV